MQDNTKTPEEISKENPNQNVYRFFDKTGYECFIGTAQMANDVFGICALPKHRNILWYAEQEKYIVHVYLNGNLIERYDYHLGKWRFEVEQFHTLGSYFVVGYGPNNEQVWVDQAVVYDKTIASRIAALATVAFKAGWNAHKELVEEAMDITIPIK